MKLHRNYEFQLDKIKQRFIKDINNQINNYYNDFLDEIEEDGEEVAWNNFLSSIEDIYPDLEFYDFLLEDGEDVDEDGEAWEGQEKIEDEEEPSDGDYESTFVRW